MIHAHRYALAQVHGWAALEDLESYHVCANLICVRAEYDPATHLLLEALVG